MYSILLGSLNVTMASPLPVNDTLVTSLPPDFLRLLKYNLRKSSFKDSSLMPDKRTDLTSSSLATLSFSFLRSFFGFCNFCEMRSHSCSAVGMIGVI